MTAREPPPGTLTPDRSHAPSRPGGPARERPVRTVTGQPAPGDRVPGRLRHRQAPPRRPRRPTAGTAHRLCRQRVRAGGRLPGLRLLARRREGRPGRSPRRSSARSVWASPSSAWSSTPGSARRPDAAVNWVGALVLIAVGIAVAVGALHWPLDHGVFDHQGALPYADNRHAVSLLDPTWVSTPQGSQRAACFTYQPRSAHPLMRQEGPNSRVVADGGSGLGLSGRRACR
jgi:hypothetical protein